MKPFSRFANKYTQTIIFGYTILLYDNNTNKINYKDKKHN